MPMRDELSNRYLSLNVESQIVDMQQFEFTFSASVRQNIMF